LITGSLYSLSRGSTVANRKGSLMACAGRAACQKGRCAAPARAPLKGTISRVGPPCRVRIHCAFCPSYSPPSSRSGLKGMQRPRPQARFSSWPSSTAQPSAQAHRHPCRLRRPRGGLSAPSRPPRPPGLVRWRASASPIVQVCGGHCQAVSKLKPPSTRRQS
jgi:hypothetical protein